MKYRYHKGSRDSAECVEFDLYEENGDYKTTCVVNVYLLICGVSAFPCGNGDDETLDLYTQLEILSLVQEERGKIIHKAGAKSFKDWEDSGLGTFEDYFIPGDTVTEDLVEHFINIMPPTTMRPGFVQSGEPYSHEKDERGCYRDTYITFCINKGEWHFCGYCFAAQPTNRVMRPGKLAGRLYEVQKLYKQKIMKGGAEIV